MSTTIADIIRNVKAPNIMGNAVQGYLTGLQMKKMNQENERTGTLNQLYQNLINGGIQGTPAQASDISYSADVNVADDHAILQTPQVSPEDQQRRAEDALLLASGDSGAYVDSQRSQRERYGNFENRRDHLDASRNLRNNVDQYIKPSKIRLAKYNSVTKLANNREGFENFKGADDTVLFKAFASMILPGEAVMEGDIQAIVNQAGLPGRVQSYIQVFKGEGTLDPKERKFIYRTMTDLASSAAEENQSVRNQFENDVDVGGFDPQSIFGKEQVMNDPYPISFGEKSPSEPTATPDIDAIALEWAKQNPNDPRAAQILKANGVQ